MAARGSILGRIQSKVAVVAEQTLEGIKNDEKEK